MKKYLLLSALLLAAIVTSAFSVAEWRDSLYEQIRAETIKALRDQFKREVKIGSVEGRIVGRVVFNDVAIPDFAEAKKITIDYSLIKFAYKKDIVPAISGILIEEGIFKIRRDRSENINALHILPEGKPGDPPPPPFNARLAFKNCRVDYRDEKGFRGGADVFSESMIDVNGSIDLSKKDRIKIDLAGSIMNPDSPARIKGDVDLAKNKFSYAISASRLDLKKWGDYALPFDMLAFEGGRVDLSVNLSSPKIKGRPLSVRGDFTVSSADLKLGEFNLKNTSGRVALDDNSMSVKEARAEVNGLEFTGRADASASINGIFSDPSASGKITVRDATFMGQAFSGTADLNYAKKLLSIRVPELAVYRGKLSGECAIDYSKTLPSIAVRSDLRGIRLDALAQGSPGITGQANGELSLFGPVNRLSGSLEARLLGAELLGQPIEKLSSLFSIQDGAVSIQDLSASSATAFIRSAGTISPDLNFNFRSSARGIELAGEGLLGRMGARVDEFTGNVAFDLNDAFLAAPLKNLRAEGDLKLARGRIGEQLFDEAAGHVEIGDGLIRIENVMISRNDSLLNISGQTGIGHPTRLKAEGIMVNLSDFKILNVILPEEARDPAGFGDISVEVTGELSRETHLTSLDPLFDLNAEGKLILTGVRVADIPIEKSQLNFVWKDHDLSFPDCTFKTPRSDFYLNLAYRKKEWVKGSLSGILDFSEFKKFTRKYGNLGGLMGLSMVVEGKPENPGIAMSFWLDDFVMNKLNFEQVEGSLSYVENVLTLSRPVKFVSGHNEFTISGSLNLAALQTDTPEESSLDLNLKVEKADLSYAIELADKINGEVSRRLYLPDAADQSKVRISAFQLPSPDEYIKRGSLNLYSGNGKKDFFLKAWEKETRINDEGNGAKTENEFGGQMSGNISLTGKFNALSGKFNGEVEKGYYKKFEFDRLRTKASLKDNRISIEELELAKKQGRLNAKGEIVLNGDLSLELSATRMPLDILLILFDQDFKGVINMRASLGGPTANPQISASVSGGNLTLAGVPFDKIEAAVTKNNGYIQIHEFMLESEGQRSNITGTIESSGPGTIDLRMELKDNGVGLFNLINKDVLWKKGKAGALLEITGPLSAPRINGAVDIHNAQIYVRAINSEIRDIQGSAEVINGIAAIPALTGNWQGEKTRGYPNFIGLAGTVDLNHILDKKGSVFLDLAVSPFPFYVDFPNLYTGVVDIKEAQLMGPLRFDLSQGPTVKGKAGVNNAVIDMTRRETNGGKIFPANYDLELTLDRNVYGVMGDVATLDLSNIFMTLEIRSDKLLIGGSSSQPSLLGRIDIRRGTVNIFNREFTLLNAAQQENYYRFNPDRIRENTAVFSGEKGAAGVQPDVTITAKVDVEETERNELGDLTKKKVIIISRLRGVIGAKEKERALDISLDSFVEDTDRNVRPGGYGEQTIKAMLLPDFIKVLTGIDEGENADPNLVVADYVSGRVQTLFFRGIERDLEQRLGLESLTLEYNFGKDVRQAMGVTEQRALEGEKPDWRVGFVKGFFDKFFVDVKYSQFNLETGGQENYLNYQLTYKLSPIWSIIYYREPASFKELISGDEKITLKAGFSFW